MTNEKGAGETPALHYAIEGALMLYLGVVSRRLGVDGC
jgi:hypothetical protein